MDIQNTYTCNICGFTTSNIDEWKFHQYYNDHDLIEDDKSDVDSLASLGSLASLASLDYDATQELATDNEFDDMEEDDMEEDDGGLTRTLTYDELQQSMLLGKPRVSRRSRNPNWKTDLVNHGNNAVQTAEYLFRIIDKSGLTSYQIDILEQLLKYGIRKIQCNEPAKFHLKELWELYKIESDTGEGSGDMEDILCNILQKGVLTIGSVYILNSPRQYKGRYIYLSLKDLLLENEELVKTTFRELLDIWLTLIERITDTTNYSCFRNKYYTLPELIELLDNINKLKKVHHVGGEPYTFQQLYNEMIPDDEGPWQHVVDFWEEKMLDWLDPEDYK